MKKLVKYFGLTIMLVTLLSAQLVKAESYQRWIYWMNQPNHIATANEEAEIIMRIGIGEIHADSIYCLLSGITFKIPQPSLYVEYVIKAVHAARASVTNAKQAADAIMEGEEVKWGNDISYKVRNYYYSNKLKTVTFIGNYSGSEKGVEVLLIDGIPAIKLDCGNPLEVISENYVPKYTQSVKVPQKVVVTEHNKVRKSDTTYVIVQLEQNESPQPYPTEVVYVHDYQPPMSYYSMNYPVFVPFLDVPCGYFSPYPYSGHYPYGGNMGGGYGGSVYVDNSSYYNNVVSNNYNNSVNGSYNNSGNTSSYPTSNTNNSNYDYNYTNTNNTNNNQYNHTTTTNNTNQPNHDGHPVGAPGHNDGTPSYTPGNNDGPVTAPGHGDNASGRNLSTQQRSFGTRTASNRQAELSSSLSRALRSSGSTERKQVNSRESSYSSRSNVGSRNNISSNVARNSSSSRSYGNQVSVNQTRQSNGYRSSSNYTARNSGSQRSFSSSPRSYSQGSRNSSPVRSSGNMRSPSMGPRSSGTRR